MNLINALHIRFEGVTASFRYPLIISGNQINMPMPSYSTILGIISACAGRIVKPSETKIGFEFHCTSKNFDLERSLRWETDDLGRLKPHHKGQGIYNREIYWFPKLDLYLSNPDLKEAFDNPAATPCLGRSQDIAWITRVKEIILEPTSSGKIGPTMLSKLQKGVPVLPVRAPEWIDNSREGYLRELGPFGMYLAVSPLTDKRFPVRGENFYHPEDAENPEDVIYLHHWLDV